MSDTYTKLFSSITESTVWGEPYATRIVWVAMLAMADAKGNVYGSVPGLARRANVTLQEAEKALESFRQPDPYSRTKDADGRRIENIDGGWRLINHGKYGAIRGTEERREYKREWDRKNRSKAAKQADSSDNESDRSDENPTNPTDPAPPTPTPTLEDPPIPPTGGKRGKSERITFATFVQTCRERGEKPIPPGDPIFKFARDTLIPVEMIALAWRAFATKHRAGRKQQAGIVGWRAHFRDAVRGNWAKVWYFPNEGAEAALTTVGIGLKRERDAESEQQAGSQQGQAA